MSSEERKQALVMEFLVYAYWDFEWLTSPVPSLGGVSKKKVQSTTDHTIPWVLRSLASLPPSLRLPNACFVYNVQSFKLYLAGGVRNVGPLHIPGTGILGEQIF